MPESMASPHRRQRHPATASAVANSFIITLIMRPWQRKQCIESSPSPHLQDVYLNASSDSASDSVSFRTNYGVPFCSSGNEAQIATPYMNTINPSRP